MQIDQQHSRRFRSFSELRAIHQSLIIESSNNGQLIGSWKSSKQNVLPVCEYFLVEPLHTVQPKTKELSHINRSLLAL